GTRSSRPHAPPGARARRGRSPGSRSTRGGSRSWGASCHGQRSARPPRVRYAVAMKLPADAGAVLIDLRARRRFGQLVVWLAILVVAGLLPAGDPKLWPVSAFIGGITVLSIVLLALVRRGSRRV